MEIEVAKFGGELGVETQEEFINGIQTLDNVVNILCEVNDSTSAVEEKEIVQKLSLPIHQAHENFTRALALSEGETARLDGQIEGRVQEISKQNDSVSQKQVRVAELSKKLESLSKQIDDIEKELSEAKSSLNQANDRLREQRNELEKRERDQKIVAGVGVGISLIPIVGWIAGPTMVVISLTAMQDAINASENNVKSARGDVRSCEDRLSDKRKNQDDLQQQLSRENSEKQATETKLVSLKANLQRLQEEQKSSLVFQEKLRNTCHFMTKIWGKSNVLKMESSENAYSLQPLFTPLKEIAEMLTLDEQNKFKVETLLQRVLGFSSMSSKMKAICQKIDCSDLV